MENSKKFLLKICIMFVNDFISIQKKKANCIKFLFCFLKSTNLKVHKNFILFFKEHKFKNAESSLSN